MKLKITSGEIDVEVIDGSLSINEIRLMLKKMGEAVHEETVTNVREAGKFSPNSSKSNQQNKLNAKPKLPI